MSAPHKVIRKLPGQVLPTVVYSRMQNMEWGNVIALTETWVLANHNCIFLHASQALLRHVLEVPSSLFQDRLLHSNGSSSTTPLIDKEPSTLVEEIFSNSRTQCCVYCSSSASLNTAELSLSLKYPHLAFTFPAPSSWTLVLRDRFWPAIGWFFGTEIFTFAISLTSFHFRID